MAVGFTPKHLETYPLGDLSPSQFLALAVEAVKRAGWNLSHTSDAGLIAFTNNGVMSWNGEVKIKIEGDTATIQSASTGSDLIDFGKNKKTVSVFIRHLEELKASVSKEEADRKYTELKESITPADEDVLVLPPPSASEQVSSFLSFFIPKKGFFITPLLIDLNLLVFILMFLDGADLLSPSSEMLLSWGANFRPLTLAGEWWRLITCCFLHIGIIHLLLNLYALLYIGVLLEPLLGSSRFAWAYLIAGVISSAASLWWHDITISAGASGSIFGLYGVFLALLTTNLIEKSARQSLLASIAVFVGYNLIYGMKGGIDNAAHIGGLISGLAFGYALIPGLKKPDNKMVSNIAVGGMAVVMVVFSSFIYFTTSNDIAEFDKRMEKFAALELKALEVYHLPENTPNEKILQTLKPDGINHWKECLGTLNTFGELDIPVELRTRVRLLKEYCTLRMQSYETLYKAISEDTDEYQKEIEANNLLIEEKMKELGGEPKNK